jgi:hypothetical protein
MCELQVRPNSSDVSESMSQATKKLTLHLQSRIRRIKCDEGKPECNRCKIFGITCDGYVPPPVKGPRPNRSLLQGTKALKILPAISGNIKFQTEAEEKHFQRFQTEIAGEISGTFFTPFWNNLILRAAQDEPFVLDTVIALSSLGSSKKMLRGTNKSSSSLALATQYEQFAFGQYQKALQVMRTSLSNHGDPRKALIGCILVCCFEGLAGNILTALAHARSGQKLLQEWLSLYPTTVNAIAGFSSPASHIIEDELMQAASFFDHQIVGFFDSRPAEVHSNMRHDGDALIENMPDEFKTLEEARLYHILLQRRASHFICETCKSRRGQHTHTTLPTENEVLEGALGNLPIDLGPSMWHLADIDYECMMLEGQYRIEQARWGSAFGNLYWKVQRSSNQKFITAAHVLAVSRKSVDIALTAAVDTNNCSFDKHLSEFQDIVVLCKEIIKAKKNAGQAEYSFELGIVPALHLTAKWCRDRFIRRDAISLMQWYAAREGLWDSLMLAAMCTCLMELEEDGIERDYIPESSRCAITNVTVDQEGKCAILTYVRGSRETGQSYGEARISW